MHLQSDDLLVVRSVEDADTPPLRQGLRDAPEEVVVELLGGGLLERDHLDALRVHPDITCLITESLPAASIA